MVDRERAERDAAEPTEELMPVYDFLYYDFE